MTGFPLVPLREVCEQARITVRPGGRNELRYVGLETIEAGTGVILDGQFAKTPEDPKANSFLFGSQHVLYGKLRPYLNKVAVPDFEGKCSTEIIPLLPKHRLNRNYLAYYLRSPSTVERIAAKTAGARMPRADMDLVLGLYVPLPSLEEQRRIVDMLTRAEGIVRLRRDAKNKAAELVPAIFLDMFGDPATNQRGWPVQPLGELIDTADYGTSTKASADGSGIAMIRMGNVRADGATELDDLKYVNLDLTEIERYRLRKGDILFNRTNSKELVGKTGLWDVQIDAVAASYFIRVRVQESVLEPTYLWAFMNTRHMKRVLFDTARGAIGQANINTKELKGFRMPVPLIDRQQRFAERVAAVKAIESMQAKAEAAANSQFASLLACAFSHADESHATQDA